MRRREFITLLGGATVWLRAAHAQQPERMRRIGVLMTLADDSEGQTRLAAFLQGLAAIGWSDGRTCGSIPAGAQAMPIACADMRRS
jgi:putative tryptophan/tyrosine transport system substrate-binding protein